MDRVHEFAEYLNIGVAQGSGGRRGEESCVPINPLAAASETNFFCSRQLSLIAPCEHRCARSCCAPCPLLYLHLLPAAPYFDDDDDNDDDDDGDDNDDDDDNDDADDADGSRAEDGLGCCHQGGRAPPC